MTEQNLTVTVVQASEPEKIKEVRCWKCGDQGRRLVGVRPLTKWVACKCAAGQEYQSKLDMALAVELVKNGFASVLSLDGEIRICPKGSDPNAPNAIVINRSNFQLFDIRLGKRDVSSHQQA